MGHQLSTLTSASSRTSHIPSPADELSDEELQNHIMNAKEEDCVGEMPELDILGSPQVYRLRPHALVAKYIATDPSNEVYIMQLVQQNTTVPVPQVRRVLPDRIRGVRLVPSRLLLGPVTFDEKSIEGRLEEPGTLIDIFIKRRNVIEALGGHFRDRVGPFPTYAAMAAWHDEQNHRYQVDCNIESGGTFFWPYSKFDTSAPLVLCHFDLHLRNIMLDKKNRVWLIDWAYAGAYPFWFEYVPFGFWANAASPDRRTPRSFARFLDFIVGSCASCQVLILNCTNQLMWLDLLSAR
ncbi:hypothetical protein EV360DRAFT_71817 [Lentinula raphanica]|nr:hypothetical protein EV360DRAFT_71817 [Lentinula raphanica]